jgi:hypothetical protein
VLGSMQVGRRTPRSSSSTMHSTWQHGSCAAVVPSCTIRYTTSAAGPAVALAAMPASCDGSSASAALSAASSYDLLVHSSLMPSHSIARHLLAVRLYVF